MLTNKNVAILNTRNYEKKTVENFQKEKPTGIIYKKCPETGKEIIFKWNGEKELREIREVYEEIRNELNLKVAA